MDTPTKPPPLLIVTRPLAQARPWVTALQAAGCRAQALPLIQIDPVDDPAPLRQAWQQLASQRVVMFVSANAVEAFFLQRPSRQDWPAGVWAACAGPGTAQALLRAGVPSGQIVQPPADAPLLESESLWPVLCQRVPDWAGQAVLLVRGQTGRDWLAQRLAAQGASPQLLQAYQRGPPTLDDAQRTLLQTALASPDRHRWLFSSSQAIEYLQALSPQADWRHSSAWVIHPRIGQAASGLGFGDVQLIGAGTDGVLRQLQQAQAPPARPTPTASD